MLHLRTTRRDCRHLHKGLLDAPLLQLELVHKHIRRHIHVRHGARRAQRHITQHLPTILISRGDGHSQIRTRFTLHEAHITREQLPQHRTTLRQHVQTPFQTQVHFLEKRHVVEERLAVEEEEFERLQLVPQRPQFFEGSEELRVVGGGERGVVAGLDELGLLEWTK